MTIHGGKGNLDYTYIQLCHKKKLVEQRPGI